MVCLHIYATAYGDKSLIDCRQYAGIISYEHMYVEIFSLHGNMTSNILYIEKSLDKQ